MRNLQNATAILALLASPLAAQEFTEDQIKELALKAIMENPQVIMEAVALLQSQ